MEDKIRAIVATFIKVPAEQIADSTPIGRAALQSSILLHRMMARLGEEGLVVQDYAGIKVFGDLMRRQNGAGNSGNVPVLASPVSGGGSNGSDPGVGIDIEEIAALPRVDDFRKEAFYTENFTPAEIAYCILQGDPYASLAGLFAVKEAIVKADGQFRHRPFNSFGIGHSPEGRPELAGFSLSISHAGGMAVAVAVRDGAGTGPGAKGAAADAGEGAVARERAVAAAGKPASMAWVAWIALLMAAAALLLALKH